MSRRERQPLINNPCTCRILMKLLTDKSAKKQEAMTPSLITIRGALWRSKPERAPARSTQPLVGATHTLWLLDRNVGKGVAP